MKQTILSRIAISAVLLASIIAASSCGDVSVAPQEGVPTEASKATNNGSGQRFWDAARYYSVSEVDPPAEPPLLAKQATAVVVGSFTGLCTRRTIQGDPETQKIEPACLQLEASEILSGVLPSKNLQVEFYLAPEDLQASEVPTNEIVIFLLAGEGAGKGRYVPFNSSGLWTTTNRGILDQPLATDVPTEASEYVGDLIVESSTWDEFVTHMADDLAP